MRILIVEDEEAIAELEKDYLELSGLKWNRRQWEPLERDAGGGF